MTIQELESQLPAGMYFFIDKPFFDNASKRIMAMRIVGDQIWLCFRQNEEWVAGRLATPEDFKLLRDAPGFIYEI